MSTEPVVEPTAAAAPAEEEKATATTEEGEEPGREEDDEEEEVDGPALLSQGIRSLAFKKYDQACDQLSRALEYLAEKHGELSLDCVDAHVLYGKALLFNAVANSAVLGVAPPAETSAAEPQPAGPSASTSSSTTPAAPVTAKSMQFHFGGDEPAGEDEEDEEEGDEEEEQGDKEDDLEASFLSLDSARIILEKFGKGEKEMDLKRAEVHRLLGDVATESEQFDSAQQEYTTSLTILTPHLPPSDRALSELHMLIALALDFVPGKNDEAVKHAELAKSVLELRLEVLEARTEKTEEGEKEKKDIKELLGDVDAKIEDLKLSVPIPTSSTSTSDPAKIAALDEFLQSKLPPNAPVNDLSNLVKKKKKVTVVAPGDEPEVEEGKGKRKAEEVEEKEEKEEKKTKVEA